LDVAGGRGKGAQLQLWECNGRENQLFYFDKGSNKITWAGDSSLCVDAGSDMKGGNRLVLWDCNGEVQQHWGYDAKAKTIYLDGHAQDAAWCMDLTGGLTDLGTPIELLGCNGWNNQKWSLEFGITIRTQFGLVYHDQDFCLDLEGGDTTKGTHVQLWTCSGLYNQEWFFDKGLIHPVADSKKCLDAGAGSTSGTQLFIWDCNGTPQQKWGYDEQARSIYHQSSTTHDWMCLDLPGGALVDGTAIQVWGCNSCWNQVFSVVGPSSSLATPLSSPVLEQEPRAVRNVPMGNTSNSCPSYPTPKVSGHCMTEAQTGYPVFSNQQDLSNSPWGKYFQIVYGEIPTTGYPICIANLMLIYSDPAAKAGVTFPKQLSPYCPKQRGDYYSVMGWAEPPQEGGPWAPAFTWIYNPILSQPYSSQGATTGLPSFLWVEVMHSGYPQDGEATWMYYTPGSAIWNYLGATAVYWDHPDASKDLLGQPCLPAGSQGECQDQFSEYYTAAIKRGLDTFQFLGHSDARCAVGAGDGNMGIEIVDVRGPGRHSCSGYGGASRFRAGWEAKSQCNCDDNLHTINCAGFGMWR